MNARLLKYICKCMSAAAELNLVNRLISAIDFGCVIILLNVCGTHAYMYVYKRTNSLAYPLLFMHVCLHKFRRSIT